MSRLTALLPVKDGGWLLPPVVCNLRSFADEVVILADTDSVDDTVEVAEGLADKCAAWPMHGFPETVTNRGVMELCDTDWILLVNDDEIWSPAVVDSIYETMASAGVHECVFPRKHLVGDGSKWITNYPWWPDHQVRLRTKRAWEVAPWPVGLHTSPPAYMRRTAMNSFLHLKFMVKEEPEREARMNSWAKIDPKCTNDHYRRFSLPEHYEANLADIDEPLPLEVRWMYRLAEERRQEC